MKLFAMIAAVKAYDSYSTSDYSTISYAETTLMHSTEPSPTLIPEFTDCGGRITDDGYLLSPNYPSSYPNRSRCTWKINLDAAGFYIIPEEFSVETLWNPNRKNVCGFDFLKVVENDVEHNFCGYNDGGDNDSHRDEDGKWTADLPNASKEGFPSEMFIRGGRATLSFSSDFIVQRAGFKLRIVKLDRLDVIEHYAEQVADSVADTSFGGRYAARMSKMLERARDSYTGESCAEENGFVDEAADVTVFDEDDMCKLNGQVNAALNSWARNYACDGRGKVYRQLIRQSRKVRNFFNSRNDC